MANTIFTILDRLVGLGNATGDEVNATEDEIREHYQSLYKEELKTVQDFYRIRSNRLEAELHTTKRRYERTINELKSDYASKLATAKNDYLTPWSTARFEHARDLTRAQRVKYVKDLRSELSRIVEVAVEQEQHAPNTAEADVKKNVNGTTRKRKGGELTSASKRTKNTTA